MIPASTISFARAGAIFLAGAGGAAALSPFPVLDLAAGCAISTKLVVELAKVYRQEIDLNAAVALLGQLGKNLTTQDGQAAARAIAVDLLGTLHAATGDLNRIKRIVKLMSLVNSTGDFTEQHLVTNGASELLGEVFGAAGAHARSAFGVAQIPLGACVEIELIAELDS